MSFLLSEVAMHCFIVCLYCFFFESTVHRFLLFPSESAKKFYAALWFVIYSGCEGNYVFLFQTSGSVFDHESSYAWRGPGGLDPWSEPSSAEHNEETGSVWCFDTDGVRYDINQSTARADRLRVSPKHAAWPPVVCACSDAPPPPPAYSHVSYDECEDVETVAAV